MFNVLEKKSMIVSDNTIEAERLGNSLKILAEVLLHR